MAYHVFISYRREGGKSTARLLYERLKNDGYEPFLDAEKLHQGKFDEQIYDRIAECSDFILVLSPNSLARCANEGDWVRLEIQEALRLKKNIVPVFLNDFKFPEEMPESIKGIDRYQGVQADDGSFYEAYIAQLKKLLKYTAHRQKRIALAIMAAAAVAAVCLLMFFADKKGKENAVSSSNIQGVTSPTAMLTNSPSPTRTATVALASTATATPMVTPAPTATPTPTATPMPTVMMTPVPTPMPMSTNTPAPVHHESLGLGAQIAASSVLLTWNDIGGEGVIYQVTVQTSQTDNQATHTSVWKQLVTIRETSYEVQSLRSDLQYTYKVTAFLDGMLLDEETVEVQVSGQPTAVPTDVPFALQLDGFEADNQVYLFWKEAPGTAVVYVIERRVQSISTSGATSWSSWIKRGDSRIPTMTDIVESNRTYQYRVTATSNGKTVATETFAVETGEASEGTASNNPRVGETYVVVVNAGRVRTGPGTEYAETGEYVQRGETYLILDAAVGATQYGDAIDWFQIKVDGTIGWVSSKIFIIDNMSTGTLNGVIIK